MNNLSDVIAFLLKVTVSAFAAAGIIEYLKNFITTTNKKIFAVIMPFLAAGCYCAVELLPIAVIGSILTIGTVQLDYQLIVQGFKKLIKAFMKKVEDE